MLIRSTLMSLIQESLVVARDFGLGGICLLSTTSTVWETGWTVTYRINLRKDDTLCSNQHEFFFGDIKYDNMLRQAHAARLKTGGVPDTLNRTMEFVARLNVNIEAVQLCCPPMDEDRLLKEFGYPACLWSKDGNVIAALLPPPGIDNRSRKHLRWSGALQALSDKVDPVCAKHGRC